MEICRIFAIFTNGVNVILNKGEDHSLMDFTSAVQYDLNISYIQGCALTGPGRPRRLTFGLERPKIYSWSPGQEGWFLDLQPKSKTKVLLNWVCVDIQRSFHVNSRVT